jgi:hypothetical protein
LVFSLDFSSKSDYTQSGGLLVAFVKTLTDGYSPPERRQLRERFKGQMLCRSNGYGVISLAFPVNGLYREVSRIVR